MSTKEKPLTILEFRANSIKALKAVTIRPDGKSIVKLTGKNRMGKSSVIDAIWMALAGKSSIPSQPVRTGEKEGSIRLDLGEFIVERRITEKGAYLNVTTKDGFKAPSAQTFLSARLGDRAQNPLEFMRLSPTEQVTALQNMVNLKLDLKEFEQVSGLSTKGIQEPNVDPVQLLDHAFKHIYDQRTDINRDMKRLVETIKSLSAQVPTGSEQVQSVSAQELFSERKKIEEQKAANDKRREAVARDEAKLADKETLCRDINKEIRDLLDRVSKLQAQHKEKKIEYQKMEGEVAVSRVAIEQLIDPDFTEIDARISAADETNRIANLVKSHNESMAEYEQVAKKSADLSGRLTAVKDLKGRLIAEAGLPIAGLGIANGEVTFNDLPISQSSTREQIEISCAICAAQNPAIGILTVDIGFSELDKDGQEALTNFAREHALQIWVTRVTEEPEQDGFHIIDGQLSAVDGVLVASGDNGDAEKDLPLTDIPVEPVPELEAPSWMV